VAKNKQQPTGRALSVEDVLKREEKRFEQRVERCQAELAEAEAELARIRRAQAALDADARPAPGEGLGG
jgi:sugar-specific transcriptional regulator TrmB